MRNRQTGLTHVAVIVAATVLLTTNVAGRQAAQTPAPVDARTWIGRAAEMEDYLRAVPILKLEALSTGVTKPMRAFLPEGGPMKYLVWKAIQPGRYNSFWESYKSEIAAYELDKLVGLNMVPPTVEKTYKGERGAAIMWAAPTKSFKDMGVTTTPPAPPQYQAAWARQIVKGKMFHNLINNIDPNIGNWLVDPAWNLILIDFSRCFTAGTNMPHTLTRVDPDLWDRFKALTEASLTPALGAYLNKGEIRSILQRRDKLAQIIDKLIKEHGEASVFMRDVGR
ncbi:MAG TPA: hypothetical protein VFV78_07825 [Vicinamibacterales bacterium]|nr:hypothetical protein [Vicinamibacterales bacterium]